MTTQEVAERLVSLCKEGKFDAAAEELYHADIVSIEPDGEDRVVTGMDAIRGKMEWWASTYDVVGVEVDGPWLNDPFFITKFVMDVKAKADGSDMHMEELGVYEVRDGKIVSERFFFQG